MRLVDTAGKSQSWYSPLFFYGELDVLGEIGRGSHPWFPPLKHACWVSTLVGKSLGRRVLRRGDARAQFSCVLRYRFPMQTNVVFQVNCLREAFELLMFRCIGSVGRLPDAGPGRQLPLYLKSRTTCSSRCSMKAVFCSGLMLSRAALKYSADRDPQEWQSRYEHTFGGAGRQGLDERYQEGAGTSLQSSARRDRTAIVLWCLSRSCRGDSRDGRDDYDYGDEDDG